MLNRQHIQPGQRIIHDLTKPLRERLKSRKMCGPFIVTPSDAEDKLRFFYLDSDFMPSLRWEWCDKIAQLIKHTGWFTNDYQDETLRGLVLRLNHGRGFLAGWSMGDGMASEFRTTIYDEEKSAAYAANDMAREAAEREREHQRISEAEQATDDAREEITEIRGHVHRLIIAIRNHNHALPEILCRELREDVRRYHHAMHLAIRTIHDNQGDLSA